MSNVIAKLIAWEGALPGEMRCDKLSGHLAVLQEEARL